MRQMARWVKLACSATIFLGFSVQAANPAAQGQLQPNEHHERFIVFNQGDLVQGKWQQDRAVSLSLYTPDGQRWRDLGLPDEKQGQFVFIAPLDGEYRISLSGAGVYSWSIDEITPLAEQQLELETPLQSDLIRQWERRLQTGESTDAFWQQVQQSGAPLRERLSHTHDRLTFVWRAAQRSARLRGGPALLDGGQMHRLGQSDIWYVTYDIPRDAFFSYQIAPDMPPGVPERLALRATLQADPYNPWRLMPQVRDAHRNHSVVALPEAPTPVLGADPSTVVASGKLESFDFSSAVLGNTRTVHIYTPEAIDQEPIEHVMVLFDGEDYLTQVNVPAMLDRLIQENQIKPLKLVLVGNPNMEARAHELTPLNKDFVDFLELELVPWMTAHGVQAAAENSIIAGSSYGGLAALNAALNLPHLFGKVISLSGSFWWGPPDEPAQWLVRQVVEREKQAVQVFMTAGLYEDNRGSQGITLLSANRHMRDVLQAKGYQLEYRESASSHGYLAWSLALPQGLRYFLAPGLDSVAGKAH